MFAFFDQILSLITILINFVVSAFKNLIWLLTNIPSALAFMLTAVGYVPIISSVLVAVLIVALVYQLINHGG